MIFDFVITEEMENQRLDVLLAGLIDDVSRSYIQKLFDDDKITVNGEICSSKKYSPKAGDEISVEIEDDRTPLHKRVPIPKNMNLNIVFEDENYIVIDKPRDMVVHPAPGNYDDTLVNGLVAHLGEGFLQEMQDICDVERPGIVHRIDKDTSGLLVVAKTRAAFESLSKQFHAHSITRKYTALVYNSFNEESGTVDSPIGRDPVNRLKKKVNGLESRHAVSHYKVLKKIGMYSLIEVQLETGRTHQIRVHMAHIGHPVVGDPVYGPKKDSLGAKGQMLHAGVLGFLDLEDKYREFSSNLPEYFVNVLAKAEKLSQS